MLQNSQENICVGVSCLLNLQVYTFYRIPLGSYFESKMQYSVLISLRWFFFKFIVNLYHWLKSKVDLESLFDTAFLICHFYFIAEAATKGGFFCKIRVLAILAKSLKNSVKVLVF